MKVDETEYKKLENYLSELELILNPNLINAFRKQLFACYEENKKEAFAAAKISNEALEIEALLKDYKAKINQHGTASKLKTFFLKCLYKELITKL